MTKLEELITTLDKGEVAIVNSLDLEDSLPDIPFYYTSLYDIMRFEHSYSQNKLIIFCRENNISIVSKLGDIFTLHKS